MASKTIKKRKNNLDDDLFPSVFIEEEISVDVKTWINTHKLICERYRTYCETHDWDYSSSIIFKKEGKEIKSIDIINIKAHEILQEDIFYQCKIANTLTDLLKKFVKEYKAFINQDRVRSMVEVIRNPIDLVISRSQSYLEEINWVLITNRAVGRVESEFQLQLTNIISKIRSILDTLSLDEDKENQEISLFDNEKIPFLMRYIVDTHFPQIKRINSEYRNDKSSTREYLGELRESLKNSMVRYYKDQSKIPTYDPTKHFFEQHQDVLDFYSDEYEKITKGLTIDGIYIHPLLYWYANYFKTDVPTVLLKSGGSGTTITNPFIRDNELFFIDNYHKAEKSNKGLFAFGTRRFGKTVMEAAILTWRVAITPNCEALVVGGNQGDLDKLTKAINIALLNVNSAFFLPRNNKGGGNFIELGVKKKSNLPIPYGNIVLRNVNGGAGRESEKTAGVTPTAFIIDEAGKFDLISTFTSSIPSFQNEQGWNVTPVLVGTGGNDSLSVHAKEMLLNPEAYKLIAMDWDLLESYVEDKSKITWKRKTFGVFLPAQFSGKEGLVKRDSTLADLKGVDSDKLREIKIKVTDWDIVNTVINEDRESRKSSAIAYQKEVLGFPIDPSECFSASRLNPFSPCDPAAHRDALALSGDTGKRVDIMRGIGTKMTWVFSNKELPSFPFKGGVNDSPVLIFEEPPENNEIDGTYVAGLDHYKNDKSTTSSMGALYIFKRNVNLDSYSNRIVACYYSRPETMDIFNENCEILLEAYGAVCLQENVDVSFQQHLNTKNKLYLLANAEKLVKSLNPMSTVKNKLGIAPTRANQEYMFNLLIKYCNEDIEVGTDEITGDVIYKKGVTRINDLGLLDEIINYSYGGNYDRLVAFGLALAWARYLDSENVMPDVRIKTKGQSYAEIVRKRKLLDRVNSPYTFRRLKMY